MERYRENIMNINKTKYRYFMDNLSLFPVTTNMIYTLPVPKGMESKKDEFFDRNYPDVKISNIKMNSMINKVAKALVALGVKRGDIVTICQSNTPETFYMDYALSKIGAVPNYIYPNVTKEEMKYYIDELDSKYMFILDDGGISKNDVDGVPNVIRKNVKAVTDGTDIKVISASPIESFPDYLKQLAGKQMKNTDTVVIENEIKWNDFIRNGKDAIVIEAPYIPNSVCAYVHTSGTSNVPKAVMMSNENINCIPRNYEKDGIIWEKGKTAVQTIPEFVSYGITTNHLFLCNNVKTVMLAEMEPKNLYDLFRKYKPHYAFTTPSHARELIKRPTDMSRAEMIVFGGDGFDDVELKMNDYIKENGGNSVAYQGYGSTEMSAVTMTNAPGRHRIGSIGKLSGETRAIIINPETKEIITEPNKAGELCLTGPGVTLGYAGNSKAETDKVFVKHSDGKIYVHMGDMISRDEDDFFYYHGRIKNVITRKSFTFSPDEIVKAIMRHPNVKQCIVIPKYSKNEGETPSAHIVLENYDNVSQTLLEIEKLVSDNVQEFHRPTDYKIRKEIPRTKNNKNNLTALKIEDSSTLYDGVLDSNIEVSTDGIYDYNVDILFDENKVSCSKEELVNKIYEHIVEISKYLKFNVGKLNIDVKYAKIRYVDDEMCKRNSYVKHM